MRLLPARRRPGIPLVPTCAVILSPPVPPLLPVHCYQTSKMSDSAVDRHKTPTEEENKNPACEDEEEKDQARMEVVTAVPLVDDDDALLILDLPELRVIFCGRPEIGKLCLVKTYLATKR
ncbi:uncharacterized protein LOC119335812 isoform X2 [Triticum dicoccoides]|uniref:uncharacterized protein LOC119335812 isoform X2 n=1 Tax=Triticum dicoccoides TaxID=85692 RepID=UPI001890CBAD|nr:uncharacterized protein LOC119335812 isoform X2 [Triticum dicoccoides]XP_044436773.1 uncharacterized protein LOC123163079 isoform X3 [Triticum aestivum]